MPVQLYHGPAKERPGLLKVIQKPQGPHNMCPVVITSFESAMFDRKVLQVNTCTEQHWSLNLGTVWPEIVTP